MSLNIVLAALTVALPTSSSVLVFLPLSWLTALLPAGVSVFEDTVEPFTGNASC